MMKRQQLTFFGILISAFLIGLPVEAQELVINEVMPSNNLTILDEDGDNTDWFELYNSGETTLDLSGIIVADSSSLDSPWSLPSMQLPAGETLLIFASDKDRRIQPLHWETIIDWGDEWSYIVPDASTPSNWYTSEFDDSSWSTGPSGFGYGDGDDNTDIGSVNSVFIRREFTIDDQDDIERILFHMDYDDAFVAYINGIEIARENITSDGPPPFDQFADGFDDEAQLYQDGVPSVFTLSEVETLLVQGSNIIAIQVHNANATSSDLTAIPFLTLGSTASVSGSLSPHVTTGTNYLHTNFKLDADGEFLMLFSSEGALIDSIFTKSPPTDVSYGRKPDGTDDWAYFNEPTPGSSNITSGFLNFAGKVDFSTSGGLFTSPVEVTLSAEDGSDIYYTTDGSLPSTSSQLYTNALTISTTTTLRAQSYGEQSIPGPISTATYLINTNHELTIVSLTTDPDNFWDHEEGIYVMGPNASGEVPHFGANFWEDWEKPIHIEMFDKDGDLAFAQDAGVKIFGGWSRANAQKSLAIFARNSYGSDEIKDKLFSDLELNEFSSIVLRNSGNDWNNTMFRDALLTSLFHESVDKQACRPAVIYLNGEYWGIQNIREKVNEDYLGNHYDIDPDSITILEADAVPVEGDEQEYIDLVNYINSNDLSNTSNYEYVSDHIDISNFIYYQIGNIFIDNRDWPGNNIKYWKSDQLDGKWRWITYDTDFGFDIWNEGKVNWNTLEFALDANGPDWPNPPWSTLLIRRLLANDDFKNQFINTFADELNTRLLPEKVIEKINAHEEAIDSEISRHISRWNGGSYSSWQNNVERMRDFADNRPAVVRQNIRSEFGLSSINKITLEVNNEAFGEIRINTLELTNYPWSGDYFAGAPVTIEALPKPGYAFLRWEDDLTSTSRITEVDITQNKRIRAVFEEQNSELNSIVINEINYNSDKDSETEDWVELFNKGDQTIDISGWILKDDDDEHAFIFENGTTIQSGGFIVICRDMEVFNTIHSISNITGNMDFGLSSDGDCVRLYNADEVLTDEVCFLSDAPWPSLADGKGGTLALKNPALDNADPSSWYGLSNNGNPGEGNEVDVDLLGVENDEENLTLFPNPTLNRQIWIKYLSKTSEPISIELLDISGRKLHTLFQGLVSKQLIKELILPENIKSGIYMIHLKGESKSVYRRLIVE
ncbi:MAG: CotH kinase family protein [Marinoscillum sp.]